MVSLEMNTSESMSDQRDRYGIYVSPRSMVATDSAAVKVFFMLRSAVWGKAAEGDSRSRQQPVARGHFSAT